MQENSTAGTADAPCFPEVTGLAVPNPRTGERMTAILFTARGKGPHPTVLLLHGYPGYENNFDLAHAFQREGYSVVTFHYRGAWGSEGALSLSSALEDVQVVLEWIRSGAAGGAYGLDPERVVLIGHSMGGFAALETAARDRKLCGVAALAPFDFSLAAQGMPLREAMQREFTDCLPVRRVPMERFLKNLEDHAAAWSFPALAEKLSEKPVCLIGAGRDAVSVPEQHVAPLYRALRGIRGAKVQMQLMDTGHCYSDVRAELADCLLRWIREVL